MDEVEGHRGRGPDEIFEPLHESGERTQLDDAEVGLGTGGHRLDASQGGTQEQELPDYLRCMPTPILVEACVDSIESALAAARPLHVTFPRAFDVCRDASRALETLVALRVERVLSSGQAATAPEGAETIAGLVRQAAGRIGVLPGGGVTPENAAALVRATGATEVHLTGAGVHQSGMTFPAPTASLGNF